MDHYSFDREEVNPEDIDVGMDMKDDDFDDDDDMGELDYNDDAYEQSDEDDEDVEKDTGYVVITI